MGCCQAHYETKVTNFENFNDFYREDSLCSSAGTVRTQVTCATMTTTVTARDVDLRKNELKRASRLDLRRTSQVTVKKYPNYDGGFDLKNTDVLHGPGSAGRPAKDHIRANRLALRSGLASGRMPPQNDGGFDLRDKDVIHELSSGEEEEEEPEQPKKKRPSKAKLLRNVLIAVRKSNQSNAFYNNVVNSAWAKLDFQPLQWPCKPISVSYCHNQIWVAQDNAITAFALDLEPVKFIELDENEMRIKHDLMYQIQAMAEVSTGQIAVACGSGLHLLAKLGRYNGRISEGAYTDVSSCDRKLYAAMYGAGKRSRIQVYDEKNDWDLLTVVKAPMDGLITINVTDKKIVSCSSTNGAIYITDLEGTLIKKVGCKGQIGTLGHFSDPRVCHGSHDGACIIADNETQQLVVLSQTGELGEIYLVDKVVKPKSAVVVRNSLYILSTEPPYTLYKYT